MTTHVGPEIFDREDTPLPDIRNIKDPIYDYSGTGFFRARVDRH